MDGILGAVMPLLTFALVVAIYFQPYIIARDRNHPNKNAIFYVNLLFGVTIAGWIVTLIWALTVSKREPAQANSPES